MTSEQDKIDNLRLIQEAPADFRKQLDGFSERIRRLKESRIGIIDWLRPLSKRMRAAVEDPKVREVVTEGDDEVQTLRGFALWSDPPPMADIYAKLEKAVDNIRRARGRDPEFDETHKELAKELKSVGKQFVKIDRWIENASTFFDDENMALALQAVGLTEKKDGVKVVGNHFELKDDGHLIRIGSQGLSTTPA